MNWLRIRPLLASWPGDTQPPTFEIMADENGTAVVELAWDPAALLAPASYVAPDNLRYYSSDVAFNETITDDNGSSRHITVPAQTITLSGNRAVWTMPQALWDGYVQETLKSSNTPPRSRFTRVLYYRVRVTPPGGSTARVWPLDSAISGNVDAPHLNILTICASPTAMVVPDETAVNAMGGITGFDTLWSTLLRWFWHNLDESSADRQALVAIFGHQTFQTEITSAAQRGKLLKLWLLGGPARRQLPRLLSRRIQRGSNITIPALVQTDLRGGKTLIDNLLALLNITPHPDIVGAATPAELVSDVVTEILDPNGQINQGAAGTCSPTSLQTMLLTLNPSEYVRLQVGLLSSSGATTLANGTAVSIPPGIFQVARYAGSQTNPFFVRTNAELAFQSTILKYAQGSRFPAYSTTAAANAPNGINTVFQQTIAGGLMSDETDRGLEGIFNATFTTNYIPNTTQTANQAAQPGLRTGFLSTIDAAQQPIPLAMYWSQPYNFGHVVLAVRRENGRVFFKNPQYAGSNPTAATGSTATNPPRRYDDASATLESISEADLLTWIKGYWNAGTAVG
ncbi:MAG: hypothetical protein H6668_12270 [Ardenticatenaceae bacterium]|nr:hypothetical protein [Ardenticatenaceae bacterium]